MFMEVPQALIDLGFDPSTTARLFDLFRETLEVTIKKTLAESPILAPPASQSQGTELKAQDKIKAADLRIAVSLQYFDTHRSVRTTRNRLSRNPSDQVKLE
jgi:hypothetical protein